MVAFFNHTGVPLFTLLYFRFFFTSGKLPGSFSSDHSRSEKMINKKPALRMVVLLFYLIMQPKCTCIQFFR